MPSLLARVYVRAIAVGVGRRLNACWMCLKHITCYMFAFFFIFIVGSVFFVLGVVKLPPGNPEINPQLGWIFFCFGLGLIICAIVGFFGRYLCNKNNRTPRVRPRPIQTHPGGRRVQVYPARNVQPSQVWSTPPAPSQPPGLLALSETSRSPTNNLLTSPLAVAERRPSNAPPTYDEAIGRNRESVVATEPPPYNVSNASL